VHFLLTPGSLLAHFWCTGHCKLTDFGLAAIVEDADSKAHSFCGTPYYVSPELITKCRMEGKERGGYSKDVDWWALGILCFELLVGGPPFDGKSGQEVYKKIVNLPIVEVASALARKGKASPPAIKFITGLLERDLTKRLGGGQDDVQSIRVHPFFNGLDWAAVENMEVTPLYKPAPPADGSSKRESADHYTRKMAGGQGEGAEKPKGIFERARRKSLEMIMGENANPSREQMAALLALDGESSDDEFEDFGFAGDDAEAAAASRGGQGGHGEESAAYKTIRALFDSYDTDRSGYLDVEEVQVFCGTLGVALTQEEAVAAAAEMELQTKKDGKVEFDEFMHWFTKKQIGMSAGSLGWRLIEAREKALRSNAFEDVGAGPAGEPSPRPMLEPPADLVPVVSFVVKHSKAKVAISIDGEGLHIMEKGENKTMSFP